ncbi:MAG TPA: TIGR03617 family F420-dependent LLM class oxidoreductase [Myxococcota bacterium]|nr:TIGR03617 family F420-dependent LLM class oxidoreductase [Myxococcota bacterium]
MRIETTLPLGDWRAAAPAARRAEQLGFDGITTPEIANDPFAPLVLAALATERIQLGTAIAVAFARSPMAVANIAWDLQVESRGRFALGLGPQVKGHNERRFSVPWSAPVPRLREYVESLRAIWRCWERREPLAYEGQHYRFTLMTPEFSPPPSGLAPIPVTIAAVGPDMLRLAGRVCDGVRLHGFCTRRYLEEVALPAVRGGLERSGRDRRRFEVWGGGFLATGLDAGEVAKQLEWCRYRIAFYGSTRTYSPVLSLHGWDDLAAKLHRMSKEGRWDQMAKEVPDDVVHEFTAAAPYAELPAAVEKRFGGLVDTIALGFSERTPDGLARELIQDLRRIPHVFAGFPNGWS